LQNFQKKEYTCPMHPEIIKQEAGNCPICGMALELKTSAGEEENIELKKMSLRFWIGLVLTIPILFLAMLKPYLYSKFNISLEANNFIQALLASPVVIWVGFPIFKLGMLSFINRSLNMFTLISLGVGAAYLYSIIATIWPSIFPFLFKENNHIEVYFEAASVITVLVILGQVLELRAREKTSDAIKKLLDLSPKTARVIFENGEEKDLPLEDVMKGNKLRVRPGEKIPTDGIILEGGGLIDESMISGEPFPLSKQVNDKVTGATLNIEGSFIMRAEKVGSETLLFRIVQMVSEAQRSRAPIQKLADQVSSYFVPAVIAIASLTFLGWYILGPRPGFAFGLINAVAVLIIACPCALGLATPMSIMVGIGKGALQGILIKNAESLETMSKVDTVAFDKTGTLTEGKPKLTAIISDKSEDEVLSLAASLEIGSEHPLGLPIVAKAKEKKLTIIPVENFKNISGKGITGKIKNSFVAIGNKELFIDLKIELGSFLEKSKDMLNMGQTVLYLAEDNKAIALLAISDVIKATTLEAISSLHKAGIRLVMLTGDNRATATFIGKTLGIDEIEAEVLPDAKGAIIQRLKKEGRIVAMAGDGINDAPALAEADVGIAMGTGTDIAIESGGITLVKGDLNGIVKARNLSILTMRNIKQNLWFAFIYNALGVPIATGILYPAFGILLSPIIASAAMTFSSLSVIMNSLRLKKQKI